ncbi:uncharacterized protein F4817DRAFT_316959 [Daldinia loculata]|uniref:uncharacterized protein n=1 Tax=Daldinia loculata TaxID=103429 RepID=UPI0020C528DF|nr:uncharacterized protein F4817DRAFT_316959 [Daldinia loculata]KAI1646235.1 hypothetical protein F4817DRAFT_316959 [Daldinia loculata]
MKTELKHVTDHLTTRSREELDIAAYNFSLNFWFGLTSSTPVNVWPLIWEEIVESVWLFALPSKDRFLPLPNTWKIALELQSGKVITLEICDGSLRRGQSGGPHIFLFRALTDDHHPSNDLDKLRNTSLYLTGRRCVDGLKLQDIVYHVDRSGEITNYSMVNGRGRRYWLYRVLQKMRPLIQRKPGVQAFHKEADDLMRRCWISGSDNTGHYGYPDEPDNPLNIKGGIDMFGGGRLGLHSIVDNISDMEWEK